MRRRHYLGVTAGVALSAGCLRLQEDNPDEAATGTQSDGGTTADVVQVNSSGDASEAWRMQRFDHANTGYNPEGSVPREGPSVVGQIDQGAGFAVDGLLAGGSAYFVNADGTVVAIDAETGEQQWVTESVGAPLIPETVATPDAVGARAIDGTVYTVDRSNGGTTGEFAFGARGFGLTPGPDREVWIAPAFDGWVRGVNPPDQSVEWETPVGGAAMPAATAGSYAFVSVIQDSETDPDQVNLANPSEMDAGGLLYVLDLETGETIAQGSRDTFAVAAPVVGPDRLYWAGFDGVLVARIQEDGEVDWRYEADDGIYQSPVLANETVVFGTEAGTIYGLDRTSGDEEWTFSTDGRIRGGPIGIGDVVCVGSDDNSMYALDIESGDLLWEFEAEAPVRSLTAGNNRVHVGTQAAIYTLSPDG